MFIRFEGPVRDCCLRTNLGIFNSAYDCIWATPRPKWSWEHTELRRELDWFNDCLDAPNNMFYRYGRRGRRSGICWFRDHATDHVTRARYMGWLLEELGYPICVHRSDVPGAIIWQDRHQIVALPSSRALSQHLTRIH